MADDLSSLREAAARSGMSASNLRLLARTGKIAARKLGCDWFTTEAAVLDPQQLRGSGHAEWQGPGIRSRLHLHGDRTSGTAAPQRATSSPARATGPGGRARAGERGGADPRGGDG